MDRIDEFFSQRKHRHKTIPRGKMTMMAGSFKETSQVVVIDAKSTFFSSLGGGWRFLPRYIPGHLAILQVVAVLYLTTWDYVGINHLQAT